MVALLLHGPSPPGTFYTPRVDDLVTEGPCPRGDPVLFEL